MNTIQSFRTTALVTLALMLLAGCSSLQTVRDEVAASEQKQNKSIDQLRQDMTGELGQLKDATEQATMAAENANLAVGELQAKFASRNDLIEKQREIVYFGFDRSDLDDAAQATLDNVAAFASTDKNYVVILEGHTDKVGSDSYNYALSNRRVNSVTRYMVGEKGSDQNRIHILGLGEGYPATDNNSKEGRSHNRRVIIRVLAPR